METQKTILMAVFFFLTYMMWQSWQQTFPDKNQLQPESSHISSKASHAKTSTSQLDDSVPYVNNSETNNTATELSSDKNNINDGSKAVQKFVTITTDLVEYKINLIGGDIAQVKLLKYNHSKEDPQPIKLLDDAQNDLYIAPNGLTGNYGPDTQKSRAEYTANQTQYNLQGDKLIVDLYLHNNENKDVKIIKSFIFEKSKYNVDIKYLINNHGSTDWNGHVFSTLKKKNIKGNSGSSMLNPSSSSYIGPAVYNTEQKFHKISPESLNNNPQTWNTKAGWIAIIQRYFVSSWIPSKDEDYKYTASINKDDIYSLNLLGPSFTVRPGETATKTITFYSGPEQADVLGPLATGLDRTVDYGILWPIASGIFWCMKKIHSFVGNWGYAIILVTILIKLLFYKLSSSSYRSMAKLKVLAPKIEQLKKKYGDDREKMGKAMMDLYKKEKVNPLGGCLPMLIQLPFFIALYWVIIESVELRQAPFILWINDLSVKDPYFILPILMGLSMLAQQKMSPAPADPMQAKVMMLMPVFFTVLFMYFPAGLVLYWVINTIASILQQWWVTKSIEGSKGGKNIDSNKLDIKKLSISKKAVNDG